PLDDLARRAALHFNALHEPFMEASLHLDVGWLHLARVQARVLGLFAFRGPLSWRSLTFPQAIPVTRPVLSPNLSRCTPSRSSIDRYRFVSGVLNGYLTCCPVFSVPPPPPTSRTGNSSWLWRLPSPMPEP